MLAAVGMTALLAGVLGSEQMIDRADGAGPAVRPFLDALTTAPVWATAQLPAGAGPAVAAKLATLLLVVAGLVGLARGVRTRVAAWLAGWGALAVAAAVAQLVYVAVTNYLLDGALDREDGGAAAAAFAAMNDGAVFGLYAGWLVGLVVALTVDVRSSAPPVPVASWPPKPSVGTNRPNPAWQASRPLVKR